MTIFKRIKIGVRTFLAPVDNPALIAQLDEIAEFAAKNPELLFVPEGKVPGVLRSMAVVFSPKGEPILKALGNVKGLKARKIIIGGAKAVRPLAQFSGNKFAISRVSRATALGINLISVSPVDILVSFAFAVAELQQNQERFGEDKLTFLGDEEPTVGRIFDVGGKKDVFVSQESLLIAQLFTETVDQLAFGFIPEAGQERATEILAAIFVEPVLDLAKFLAGGLERIQGDDPSVAPIGEAGF